MLTDSVGDQASGDCSLVSRDDGSLLWAYKGRPLYRWSHGQKAGYTTGYGVKNVWHAARP